MIAYQSSAEQERVKVLHLITHLGVGGALDNTLLTVERLPRDRYQVDLAAGHLPVDEGYQSWEERSRESADNLHFFPTLQRQVHPIRDLTSLPTADEVYPPAGLSNRTHALREGGCSRPHCSTSRWCSYRRPHLPCIW